MISQFDVYEVGRPGTRTFVTILSAGIYTSLDTLVVAPLIAGAMKTEELPIHVPVRFGDLGLIARFDLIAAIPTSAIGEKLGNLADQEYALKNAFDRLLAGY